VAGGGTGKDVAGGGTGKDVAGGGTGKDVAGGGTGNTIQVAGGGTGFDSVFITLPAGTGLEMEVSLGCQSASVSIFDGNYTEVVAFDNVSVMGNTGLCANSGSSYGGGFAVSNK
ncbi:MAG: hypothetical protein GQ538_05360, partial [Xanthomonadales bacterium]|nr:hypothetical protein [Xanthomonadales bacterium]